MDLFTILPEWLKQYNRCLQSLESDAKLWLSLNEKNTVMYDEWDIYRYRTIGTIVNNTCFDDVFEHIKSNKHFERIHYVNENGVAILIVHIKKGIPIRFYFSGITNYHFHYFTPYCIRNYSKEDQIEFHYHDIQGGHVIELTNSIDSVRELFSIIKSESLTIVLIKHKDKITTYYDSLPLFNIFSYVLGIPCDITDKEIVIEI